MFVGLGVSTIVPTLYSIAGKTQMFHLAKL
jgi:hypothetical protein